MDRDKCIHNHFQSAWRIVDGKAVYLRYDIRDLPGSTSLSLPLGIRNSRSDENVITTKAAANQKPPGEPTSSHVASFILLQQELVDNVDYSFVFVEHPEVEPTNNRSEWNARREAEIRKSARTSKTDSGAKRRSIIVTVLASLQTWIASFTVSNMLAEDGRWVDAGKSLFEMELEAIQAKSAPPI